MPGICHCLSKVIILLAARHRDGDESARLRRRPLHPLHHCRPGRPREVQHQDAEGQGQRRLFSGECRSLAASSVKFFILLRSFFPTHEWFCPEMFHNLTENNESRSAEVRVFLKVLLKVCEKRKP